MSRHRSLSVLSKRTLHLGSILPRDFDVGNAISYTTNLRMFKYSKLQLLPSQNAKVIALTVYNSTISKSVCVLSKFMTEIYNTSLATGIYPDMWKKSIIIPLRKCTKIESPSDTRPIANLSHFAKIFDKLVTNQLMEYLEDTEILSPLQSGFRKHYSTQSALLKITDDIRNGIDKGMVTILLLFDLKKAFDTVKHSTLLRIMREKNCSDKFIKWFSSYLSGRSQTIADPSLIFI